MRTVTTAAGLALPGASTIGDVTSCPGAESCKLAVTQSRGLGRLLSETLAARPDLAQEAANGVIKISGCPNGCGQHHIATLGFQGSVRKVDGRAVPQYWSDVLQSHWTCVLGAAVRTPSWVRWTRASL